jgi:hypothetical protein
MDAELDPEDAKILTLARSARARAGTSSGAAVRDETGRTYAAVDVSLDSIAVTALQLAVLVAASSGAASLEAAAVVTAAAPAAEGGELTDGELAAAWDLRASQVLLAGPDGSLVKTYLNPSQGPSA